MSVYSGFATRIQEQSYNKQIINLVKILQRRVLKFYLGEQTDEEAFKSVFQQIYNKLNGMEESKYMEPYYATFLSELCNYLTIDCQNFQKQSVAVKVNISRVPAKSVSSQQTNIGKCGCKCHQNSTDQPNGLKQQSTFLTNLDVSQQKILLQPFNISQERITQKNSFDNIARQSARQYFSVSRSSQRNPQSTKTYIQYSTVGANNQKTEQKLNLRKRSIELQSYLNIKEDVSNRSPLNSVTQPPYVLTEKRGQSTKRGRTSSTVRQQLKQVTSQQTNKSPYYSTIYTLNGKTYNKVTVLRTQAFKNTSVSPSNIVSTPHRIIQNLYQKNTSRGVKKDPNSLRLTITNEEQEIKEVNSLQEHDSKEQSKNTLLQQENPIQQQNDFLRLEQATQPVNQRPNNQNEVAQRPFSVIESNLNDVPNPNESISNFTDVQSTPIQIQQ